MSLKLTGREKATQVQIFVSWSGKPAQALADFLQTWLRQVIQELEPFMSTNSIEKGARWSPEISKKLEETGEAIVCVTSENKDAPWLNFEAGALAKATDSRVRPLLIDLAPSDVTGPLSEFQLTSASDKEDVRRLINSINDRCARPLPGTILDATFDREWPALEKKISEVVSMIGGQPGKTPRKREDVDLMAEILERVRMMERASHEQLYLSERILETFNIRSTPDFRKSSRATLRSFDGHTYRLNGDPEFLQNVLDDLKSAMGRSIRVETNDGQPFEGKIVGIRGDLPDTSISIAGASGRAGVPLLSIAELAIYPPAADDEPPF